MNSETIRLAGLLYDNPHKLFSRHELSMLFGVNINNVQTKIYQLRQAGYPIANSRGKGWRYAAK